MGSTFPRILALPPEHPNTAAATATATATSMTATLAEEDEEDPYASESDDYEDEYDDLGMDDLTMEERDYDEEGGAVHLPSGPLGLQLVSTVSYRDGEDSDSSGSDGDGDGATEQRQQQ